MAKKTKKAAKTKGPSKVDLELTVEDLKDALFNVRENLRDLVTDINDALGESGDVDKVVDEDDAEDLY